MNAQRRGQRSSWEALSDSLTDQTTVEQPSCILLDLGRSETRFLRPNTLRSALRFRLQRGDRFQKQVQRPQLHWLNSAPWNRDLRTIPGAVEQMDPLTHIHDKKLFQGTRERTHLLVANSNNRQQLNHKRLTFPVVHRISARGAKGSQMFVKPPTHVAKRSLTNVATQLFWISTMVTQ